MDKYHKIQTVFKRDPETNFKTLLPREYSLPEFEYLKDNTWVFTEKVDGTNIRIMWNGKNVVFGGKTDNAQIHCGLFQYLQKTFLPMAQKQFPEIFGDNLVCLYGEGYGAKIQKGGGRYRPNQGFVLFDVLLDGIWLERRNVQDIAIKLGGIEVVPIVGEGNLITMVSCISSGGSRSAWGLFAVEGIVARPKIELLNRKGERIITKLKVKDFAL